MKVEPVVEQSIADEVTDNIPKWLELLTALVTFADSDHCGYGYAEDNAELVVVRKVPDVFALNIQGAECGCCEKNLVNN